MRLIILLFLLFLPSLAFGEAGLTVATVLSGDSLTLSDGTTLRLTGIKSPGGDTPELAAQAMAKLSALTAGNTLTLEAAAPDRYGRAEAQAYAVTPSGQQLWLQGEMLNAGRAFVYPPRGDEAHLAEMRALEKSARSAKAGIWADSAYTDLTPDQAKQHQGSFAFVAGPVVEAKRVKDKLYLNFSADWHHDFTAFIAAHDLKLFKQSGIDVLAYKGKTIRLRGWIARDFRPLMALTDPAQIEILP